MDHLFEKLCFGLALFADPFKNGFERYHFHGREATTTMLVNSYNTAMTSTFFTAY